MSIRLKAMDVAVESTKQLIGLATGVLALTITFTRDILGADGDDLSRALLMAAWVVFLLSVVFGVLVMQFLAGMLHDATTEADVKFEARAIVCAIAQNLLFGLGLLLVVIFAVLQHALHF